MFDLPTIEKADRKAASDFRHTLLDLGFEMMQLSVYSRFCSSQGKLETYCKKVEAALPEGGKVNILMFTDKQYERILTFHGTSKQSGEKPPDQFALF